MRMAGEDSIIILQAASASLRNNDVHFPYRQDSDFLYLTGFREHSALLVLIPEEKDGRCILFCRDRDPEREMWDGRMTGLEAAVSEYGMDEAYDIKELESRLRGVLQDTDRIYFDLGRDPRFDQRLIHSFPGSGKRIGNSHSRALIWTQDLPVGMVVTCMCRFNQILFGIIPV